MTPFDEENDSGHYARLRDHVTGELKVLRTLIEKAIEQVHLAQLSATSQNEKIVRIGTQVETIERTVVRGNGTHSVLTRLALAEEDVKENTQKYAEFLRVKVQFRAAIVVAITSLIGTLATILFQVLASKGP